MGIALAPSKGVLLLELCAGRDLHAALDVLARGTQDRLFGWHRRGKRIALEVAKVRSAWDCTALLWVHAQRQCIVLL